MGDFWHLNIETDLIQLKGDIKLSESLTWLQPLNEQRTKYFATVKQSGATFREPFKYKFKGKEFECGKDDCFVFTDSFRSHPNYPVNYHFGFVQGSVTFNEDTREIKEKHSFGFTFQDGMGSAFPQDHDEALNRATEDFLTLDGKIYKLDGTSVQLLQNGEEKAKDEMMAKRNIETISNGALNN